MQYTKPILFGFAVASLILVAVYAINVFLLAFAAILLAILLHSMGRFTAQITHLPYSLSLPLALSAVIGIFILIFWLYSPIISDQTRRLIHELPQATEKLKTSLEPYFDLHLLAKNSFRGESAWTQQFFTHLLSLFSLTIWSVVGFVIFLFVGLYLALAPEKYIYSFISLFPLQKRSRVHFFLDEIGHLLRWWLLGKLLSMFVIGVLTFIGLWLLDVSLAFVLGLLAALFAFIPYIGSILAAIPALLIAFTHSPIQAFYVLLLYSLIHAIEGYLITPVIEQRTVSIPPALSIMAQMLLVVLVGGLGLALATPLTVFVIACMRQYHMDRL